MKKIFKFKDDKRDEARVLDAIKHEIRKYVKREKKKDLPSKATMYWDFDCKIGESSTTAKVVVYEELIKALDSIKLSGKEECYVEILAKAMDKPLKEEPQEEDEG